MAKSKKSKSDISLDDLADENFKPADKIPLLAKIGDDFEVDSNGIIQIITKIDKLTNEPIEERVRICYTPVIVTGMGNNIDTGEKSLQIQYELKNSFKNTHLIPMQEAYGRDVMNLTSKGINFIDSKKTKINEYFSKVVAIEKDKLPEITITSKNGWKNNDTCFVLGNIMYSYKPKPAINDHLEKQIIHNVGDSVIVNGLKSHGTIEGWKEAVKGFLSDDLTRNKIYVVMTAPILRLLRQQSFIFHNYGKSSGGKSLTSNIAMSCLGNPKILENSANTTIVGAERLAEIYTDLPLNLDETSVTKSDTMRNIVYMLANERGKTRGNKDSSLRTTSEWKTSVLTTGEAAITNDSTLMGAKVRTIEYYGGLTETNTDHAMASKDIYDNYGLIFPLYIAKIFEHKDTLLDEFKEYKDIYAVDFSSSTGLDARLIDTFSAINVAGDMIERVLKDIGLAGREAFDICETTCRSMITKRRTESYSDRALNEVLSFCSQKDRYFVYEMENGREQAPTTSADVNKVHEIVGYYCGYKPVAEIDKHSFIDLIPNVIKEHLIKAGFDLETVLIDWKEKGLLIHDPGRFTKQVTHQFKQIRCYRLDIDAITVYRGVI